MVASPVFVAGISTLSVVILEIKIFPVSAAILLFPVIIWNSNYLPTLCELSIIVNPRLAVGIIMLSITVSAI